MYFTINTIKLWNIMYRPFFKNCVNVVCISLVKHVSLFTADVPDSWSHILS